ncbi:MAG TPA: cupredoxin domain-containing protein, partial [Symbiobacteriaceae bacterium]
APAKAATGQQRVVEINVKARQWAFTPGVIEVNQGDLVRLKITSEDVTHGFFLDGYEGVRATLKPGEPVVVEFTADKAGRWMFRCAETCGTFHPYMIGWLRVKPNWYAGASWVLTAVIAAGFIGYLAHQAVKS